MKKIIKAIIIIAIIAAIAIGFVLLGEHYYIGDEFYNTLYSVSEDGESITFITIFNARYYSGIDYYVSWDRIGDGDTHALESRDNGIEHYLGIGIVENNFTFDIKALTGARVEFTFIGRGDNKDATECFNFVLEARGKLTVREDTDPRQLRNSGEGVSPELLPFKAIWNLNGRSGLVTFCSAEDDNTNMPEGDIYSYYPMAAMLSASSMFFEEVINDVPDGAEVKVVFDECVDEFMPLKVSVLMRSIPYIMGSTIETREYNVKVWNGCFTIPVEYLSDNYQYYIIACEWKNGRTSYYCFSVDC